MMISSAIRPPVITRAAWLGAVLGWAIMLGIALGLVSSMQGCGWWQERANDWACPDHTLSCTCIDPKRHIDCQTPTESDDPNFFPPLPNPGGFGAKHDAGGDGDAAEAGDAP